MEMLKHVVAEAERLNMGIDMTSGTGWPFGGPLIDEEHAAKAFDVIETEINNIYKMLNNAKNETIEYYSSSDR